MIEFLYLMLKLKLYPTGKKNQIKYRIVVAEARSKRTGKYIESLGFYDPQSEPANIKIDKERYNEWIFKVYDTGIGIERKDFPLIFKEFKRVESTYVRSVPGTGLGLSLTKRLIELHGGEISFTSMLGTGSTFTFSISKKLAERNF